MLSAVLGVIATTLLGVGAVVVTYTAMIDRRRIRDLEHRVSALTRSRRTDADR